MNQFLKIVFLILLIEVGVIIGANIKKQDFVIAFDDSHLASLSKITLNEFDLKFNETIKDSKGLGLGKGIIQYSWNFKFEMGVDFNDWAFNADYDDNIVYIDAPELQWFESDVQFLKQQQLDATSEERNARMFELASKQAQEQSVVFQKELLSANSIFYQHAKFTLENKIRETFNQKLPDLIIENVVIRNWP